MLFLTSIVIACAFAWFCAKLLKNHPLPFYIGAAVVTVVMSVLGRVHLTAVPAFVNTYVIGIFTHGALAAALWCVVAGMGALPNGSAPIKRLMPVRGELSIFTALLTISHAVTYGITYLQRLISGNTGSDASFILTCIVSLLLMVIMIPLTIMSFKAVRKKIKPKTWKLLQRAAYGFYALIYFHVLIIYLPRARMGREGALLSILVYTAVFAGYAFLRIRKYIITRKKPESRAALNGICTACFALIVCGMGFAARPVSTPVRSAEVPQDTTAETATETETAASESVTETETETDTETETETETESESASEETTESESASEEDTTEAQQAAEPAPQDAAEPAPAEAAAAEPAPAAEPEPVYVYNNGVYHVDIFGYDAYEHFDITIENDVIIAIEGYCDESDPWYFDSALPVIRGAILGANSPDVPDSVSGATISSDCIKQAVRQALDQARK